MPSGIGAFIKSKRTAQKLTLKEVSEKSGLSVSFLSQFERGLTTISIDALTSLADTLNIDIRELMEQSNVAPVHKYLSVLHSFERPAPQIAASDQIQTELSLQKKDLRLLPRLYTLLPRQTQEHPVSFSHKGEEFIYVLEGILTLVVDGALYHLYPEDTAHFSSTKEHIWYNETSHNVKFILVNLADSSAD